MAAPDHPPIEAGFWRLTRQSLPQYARILGETLFLGMAALVPWFYGGLDEQVLSYTSVALWLLAICYCIETALTQRLELKLDPVVWCLFGLIAWTLIQMAPLPQSVVGIVSPVRLHWHEQFLPAMTESTTSVPTSTPRSSTLPLAIYPEASRQHLTLLISLTVYYLIGRSWLASRDSFRRLAWVLTINGVLMALFSVGHALSAKPGMMYWTEPLPNAAVFGPFACRNHYPDYIALAAGMALGLMLRRSNTEEPSAAGLTPRQIGLACVFALMLMSVFYSLSRGGVFSFIAASAIIWLISRIGQVTKPDQKTDHMKPLFIVITVAFIITGWFGTAAVEERFRTSRTEELIGARLGIWLHATTELRGFWLTGAGAGSTPWTSLLNRSSGHPDILNEHLHNEYLEAWTEGGLIRLGLTLALVGLAIWTLTRGFLQRRSRSVGSLLLGSLAAILVAVVHNGYDFAIRMPGVALGTAAVLAFAMAAAQDPGFVPTRMRVRRVRSESGAVITENLGKEPEEEAPSRFWIVTGWQASLVGVILLAAATVVAWELRLDWTQIRYRAQAELLAGGESPDRFDWRARYLQARAELRPTNAEAQADAAQSLLDAATYQSWTLNAAVSGVASAYLVQPTQYPDYLLASHVEPAIAGLQKARRLNPLLPISHGRLALLSAHYQTTEPPRTSFQRFQALSALEPDVWYLSGRDAFRRGDWLVAWADWQRCLELSGKHLKPILAQAETRLSFRELAERLLPTDPVAVWRVVQELHPSSKDPMRANFLRVIAKLRSLPRLSAEQLQVLAFTFGELDQPKEAEEAWLEAIRLAPERIDLRDRFSRWLEQEERYREAIVHLEWLLQNERDNRFWQERLDAMRHGLSLESRILGK